MAEGGGGRRSDERRRLSTNYGAETPTFPDQTVRGTRRICVVREDSCHREGHVRFPAEEADREVDENGRGPPKTCALAGHGAPRQRGQHGAQCPPRASSGRCVVSSKEGLGGIGRRVLVLELQLRVGARDLGPAGEISPTVDVLGLRGSGGVRPREPPSHCVPSVGRHFHRPGVQGTGQGERAQVFTSSLPRFVLPVGGAGAG